MDPGGDPRLDSEQRVHIRRALCVRGPVQRFAKGAGEKSERGAQKTALRRREFGHPCATKKRFEMREQVQVVGSWFSALGSEEKPAQGLGEKSGRLGHGVPQSGRDIGHKVEHGASGFERVDEIENNAASEAQRVRVREVLKRVGPVELGTVFGVECKLLVAPGKKRCSPRVFVKKGQAGPKRRPWGRIEDFMVVIANDVMNADPGAVRAAEGFEPWCVGVRDALDLLRVAESALDLQKVKTVAEQNEIERPTGFVSDGFEVEEKRVPPPVHGVDGRADCGGALATGKASGPEGEVLEGAALAEMKIADEHNHEGTPGSGSGPEEPGRFCLSPDDGSARRWAGMSLESPGKSGGMRMENRWRETAGCGVKGHGESE